MAPADRTNRHEKKLKGLQRLRWWCEVCQKQTRDENGFKQHTLSEGHVRAMQVVAENPKQFIEGYSRDFQRDFLQLLRTSHGEKAIQLNHFYQEYISDKTHVHLNSTKWPSLTEFAKYLGREGICRVEEKDDGIFVQWIDNSPDAVRRRDVLQRANRLEEQEVSEQREILKQVERARQKMNVATEPEPEQPAELAKEKWTDFSLNLKSSTNSPKPVEPEKQVSTQKATGKPAKKPNVFGTKRKQPSDKPDAPRKMTEIERIIQRDMEQKRRRVKVVDRCLSELGVASYFLPLTHHLYHHHLYHHHYYHHISTITTSNEMATDPSKYKLNHTMLRVKDPERSLSFYKFLGLSQINRLDFPENKFSLYFLAYDGPQSLSGTNAWTDRNGVLELTHNHGSEHDDHFSVSSGNTEPHRGFGHIAIAVDNIELACRRLEEAGHPFQKKLSDGRMKHIAFALDPDGYWVELIRRGDADEAVAATDPASYRLNHTMLRVKDQTASLKFYQETMGMTLLRTAEAPEAGFNLYFLGYPASNPPAESTARNPIAGWEGLLELTWNYGTEKQDGPVYHDGNSHPQGFGHICVTVDDVEAACGRFESLGVRWKKRLTDGRMHNIAFLLDPDGYWVEVAQNEALRTDEPVEYDDDEDYSDNCFFFPEDCVYNPPDCASNPDAADSASDTDSLPDEMTPALPEIKMLDTAALAGLLADNLAPPEITSIFIFAANGAVFAHASGLPQRRIRNLCATYGAAYKSYAVKAPQGNLTGVSASVHPSAFSSAPSIPLGNVGSIMFELQDMVAVVTKIADKVLLAVVGPTHVEEPARTSGRNGAGTPGRARMVAGSAASDSERTVKAGDSPFSSTLESPGSDLASSKLASSAPNPASLSLSSLAGRRSDEQIERAEVKQDEDAIDQALRAQWAIDRSHDLDRLAGLNLASSPHILLALESKSAALGKFLGNKLADLESPEDF
ncbi:uncharacterized protein GIQ15_03761 [Arthroderma uncinatum]|uniref:uncharacterized protein n=1 Tax=Arthroderma uncinatum TaxID=74035 RepID=UPI00144A62B3|nr:uncharacterized protein GIQ15_03761 [Arthroderma uncinatum]KAF3484437.1 hypothetical protein GIQ15_03761 [Arthroderma uncinatum]